MLKFLKKLLWIVKNYDYHRALLGDRVTEATNIIRERTEVHADIHLKSPSQVITIGRYHGRDFVNIYEVETKEFEGLIEHLKRATRYAKPGRFDAPLWPMVHAVIDKELKQ